MKPNSTLLIRADADSIIGTGHVMRCFALAQAWQDASGKSVFAAADLPDGLAHKLGSEGFAVSRVAVPRGSAEDAGSTIEIAKRNGAGWVVIDGDHFDASFIDQVRAGGLQILLLDDFAQRESYSADVVFNPNLGATEQDYRIRGAKGSLLLGESYVMLRREFTSWHNNRQLPEKGGIVLVTLGGSDPENLTPKIVRSLRELPDFEITAIVGPGSIHAGEIENLAASNVRILSDPPEMRRVMEAADLAVIAAGGTLWELLYMQCAVLSYARNPVQASVIDQLDRDGAIRNMGATRDFDGPALAAVVAELAHSRSLRERMTAIGRRIIDGRGATRVLQSLRDHGVPA